jgi:thiosulfate dehydrogenase [quinone] large subunit
MLSFFEILDFSQGLALIRIGLGLWWIKSTLHKPYPRFVQSSMANWTVKLAENHPLPWFGRLIGGMVDRNRAWFPYLVVAGEAAVGIGLTFGFLTPLALAIGLVLNLNYIALAGVRPKDLSVNEAYQSEQGQNWNMIVPELVLLLTGGWTLWSVDALLGWF